MNSVPIGSTPNTMTIGISDVACLAAEIVGLGPATITSTLSPTSSEAAFASRSGVPFADRRSMITFCPSTYPRSPQTLLECVQKLRYLLSWWQHEQPDPVDFPRLLRPCNERRGEEATGQSAHERSTLHYSIT